MSAKVLYISYDGLMEPLGQSQVFQYLRKLARGHDITLISYEKPSDWADEASRKALTSAVEKAGIQWRPLRYHKRPSVLATSYDLLVGFFICAYLTVRHRIQIVHARSYVPSVLALLLKKLFRTHFIFDMRGFWADERVEGDIWGKGCPLYRVAKWFERRFLTRADVVVALTQAGVAAMRRFPYLRLRAPRFEVIPTCTNLELFRPTSDGVPASGSADRPFTLGYVGAVSVSYLFDAVLDCFKLLRKLRADARLLILNRSEHGPIRKCMAAKGISESLVEIKSVNWADVPREMNSRMDAAIFFIKPVFSKLGSMPTKLGEFLACGIPCLTNAAGDVEQVLEGEKVGVVLRSLAAEEQEKGLRRLVALADDVEARRRCVEVAQRYFSLEKGVQSYDRIYRDLVGTRVTQGR